MHTDTEPLLVHTYTHTFGHTEITLQVYHDLSAVGSDGQTFQPPQEIQEIVAPVVRPTTPDGLTSDITDHAIAQLRHHQDALHMYLASIDNHYITRYGLPAGAVLH